MTGAWNPEYGRAYRERKRLGVKSTYVATLTWEARLELKIIRADDPDGCWIWTGGKDHSGYGIAHRPGNRSTTAHRDVYEHLVGPVPADMQLDHLCRVRTCVNPDHLEVVTPRENSQRASHWWGKKPACIYGHPFDEANTRHEGGRRRCRMCCRDRSRRCRERKRVA